MEPGAKKKWSPVVWVLAIGCGCLGALALAGVVAAIAVPAFVKYQRRSKVAEATANIRQLIVGFESWCAESGQLPDAAGPLPPVPGEDKQLGDFASDPGFAQLRFDPGPVYYSYSVEPDGMGNVTLAATGDLDGDGQTSRFSSQCSCSNGCTPVSVSNELE